MNTKSLGFEAHKLINISLGKIAQSRSTRTGTSLHKSLLVASVLHKARFVYLQEASAACRTIYGPPTDEDDDLRAPSPVPDVTVTPVINDYTDLSPLVENKKVDLEDELDDENKENSYTTLTPPVYERLSDDEDERPPLCENNRKRRLVTEQETALAISSILPKKLKTCEDYHEYTTYSSNDYFEESDSESSSEYCEHEGDEDEETNSMEVDHLTSLVSIISFSPHHQDLCSSQAHVSESSSISGLPVLALTA